VGEEAQPLAADPLDDEDLGFLAAFEGSEVIVLERLAP